MKFTKESWESCEKADLMLKHATNINVDVRILILANVECAKTVEHLMSDERSINALRVAEKFARGEAEISDLNAAYAYDYAYASDYAYVYADDATKKKSLKEMSEIVRKAIPFEIIEKAQSDIKKG